MDHWKDPLVSDSLVLRFLNTGTSMAAVFVIPAKAGIQYFQEVLDPGLRRGDVQEYATVFKK